MFTQDKKKISEYNTLQQKWDFNFLTFEKSPNSIMFYFGEPKRRCDVISLRPVSKWRSIMALFPAFAEEASNKVRDSSTGDPGFL